MRKKNLIFAAAALGLLAFGVWLLAPELGNGWGWLSAILRRWQMELQRELAAAVRAARDGGWAAAGPLATVSFIYGVVHAAGPGHGKAVIGAYVLANGARLRRGLALAWIAAGLQAVTAVTLVGAAVWLFGAAARDAQAVAVWLERAGYALVLALGLVMLWRGAVRLRSAHGGGAPAAAACGCGHDHHHHHDHHHDHHDHDHDHHRHNHVHEHGASCGHVPPPPPDGATWREAAVLAVSVGLRPCSGALLVLTFASAMGVMAAGIAAAFAMAVGTAITVSALAVLAAGSRRLASAAAAGDTVWLGRIEGGLTVVAGLALVVIGAAFLSEAFSSAPPLPFR